MVAKICANNSTNREIELNWNVWVSARPDLVSKQIDGIGIDRAIEVKPKAAKASEQGTTGWVNAGESETRQVLLLASIYKDEYKYK